jgi:hypothetical protein
MKIIKPNNFTLISSNVPDTAYPAWDSATAYSVGAIVSYTNHGEYQALSANTNKDIGLAVNIYDAVKNPSGCWKFLGTTNRWKMFDQFLNTQTTNASTITATVSVYDAQSIFVGNVNADSVQVQIKDNSTSSIIEDVTYSLLDEPTDWLSYFYSDISYVKSSIIHERTTLTRDVSVIVTATSSVTAAIGIFLAGSTYSIGLTQWNFKTSALDYSVVATDTSSGATYLQQGNYAKLWDGQMFIDTDWSNSVYATLINIRGTPVVFYDKPDTTLIYGFIKTFEMTISGTVETRVDLKLQGLI